MTGCGVDKRKHAGSQEGGEHEAADRGSGLGAAATAVVELRRPRWKGAGRTGEALRVGDTRLLWSLVGGGGDVLGLRLLRLKRIA